jgi:predicted ribosomally synthesized peptide with SipW-like signal peptide
MRSRNWLLTAAVIGAAVVAGLLGVGGTWALWNAVAPSDSGTVQSADFRVDLNGSPMVTDGVSATVAPQYPAGNTAITPDTPLYATVRVANATNAGGPFTITAALGTPTVANASASGLASALTVQSAPMPASGQCSGATYTSTPASAPVTKNASTTFCLRLSLPSTASETLTQATAAVTVPVTATQTQ